MLLNVIWLIPGLPLMASIFVGVLLLSFNKTMNRLTKPVSYFFIASLALSEIINFILFKQNVSGNELLFGGNLELIVDRTAIIFAESAGLLFLLIMVYSFARLERRNGYVRYFIFLGFSISIIYLFSFSGSLFHYLYDPLISYVNKIGISL